MILSKLSKVLALSFFILTGYSICGQYRYTNKDSTVIYNLLNLADELDFQGKIDSAFKVIASATLLSRDKNFIRGEGFAILKQADLTLKSKGSIESVLSGCRKGISLGHKIEDYFITGLGKHQISQYFRDKAAWDSTIYYLNEASKDYTKIALDEYLAYAYNDLGFSLDKKGDYQAAILYYLKAISIFEKIDVKKEVANTLNNIAYVYNKLNNRPEAIKYFKQSIQLSESIRDIKRLAAAYGNLAITYSFTSLDSAEYYQKKAVEYAAQTGVLNTMAQANANTATLLSRNKKYDEAITYEQKAIEQFITIGDRNKLAQRHLSLATLFHLKGDSLQAEQAFGKADDYIKTLGTKPVYQTMHEQKSKFYADRNDYKKAFHFFSQASLYKDSLLNEKALQNIAELQTKYDVTKKDLEISKLNADQQLQQIQLTNQKVLLKNQALVALGNIDKITILEQEKILNEIKLKAQQAEIQNTINENNLTSEKLKNEKLVAEDKLQQEKRVKRNIIIAGLLSMALGLILFNQYKLKQRLSAQEQLLNMRNTISKDLHDEVGSTLTSISMLSKVNEKAWELKPDLVKENLTKISTQSKSIQQNLSDIVWAIRPDTEKARSLISRVREFAASVLEPANISLSIDANDQFLSISLNEVKRKEILLILKEAINNIVKHAQATTVKIGCVSEGIHIKFTVQDNGHWQENPYSTGTGLQSMQERARKIGGSWSIQKSAEGTSIKLVIPIN